MIACQEKAYVVVPMGSEDQNTITWSCQRNFDKQKYVHKASSASWILNALMGKCLITIDGEEWDFHCQIVNCAFHKEKFKVK
jgi:cytochrome P450